MGKEGLDAGEQLAEFLRHIEQSTALYREDSTSARLTAQLVATKTVGQQFLTAWSRQSKRFEATRATSDDDSTGTTTTRNDARAALAGPIELRHRARQACVELCGRRVIARDVGPVAGVIFATLLELEPEVIAAPEHAAAALLWRYCTLPTSTELSPLCAADFIAASDLHLPLCRGLLAACSLETLMAPLPHSPPAIQSSSGQHAVNAPPPETLLGLLYQLAVGMATDQDSQYRFMAFDTLTQWLQRTAVIVAQHPEDEELSGDALLDEARREQLVSLIWDSWRDAVDAVQHKVKLTFQGLLRVLDAQPAHLLPPQVWRSFRYDLLQRLLQTSWREKMKYGFLGCLVPYLGDDGCDWASEEFLCSLLLALSEVVIGPHAVAMLVILLQHHYQQCRGASLGDWEQLWIPFLCRGLLAEQANTRKLTGRLVQKVLAFNKDAFSMLHDELSESKHDHGTAAVLAILKAAKSLDILPRDTALLLVTTVAEQALDHLDEQVRLDTMSLLCEAKRTSDPVTEPELALVRRLLRRQLGQPGAQLRQETMAALAKLLRRLHDNATYHHSATTQTCGDDYAPGAHFVAWLLCHCLRSLYPGAPFPRVAATLQLLHQLIEVFFAREDPTLPHCAGCATLHHTLTTQWWTRAGTRTLLDLLLGSYEASRAGAARCLAAFPAPLPGYTSPAAARQLLDWGIAAVQDPKAAQSDGGAAVILLCFQKYVCSLGWSMSDSDNNPVPVSGADVRFVSDWLVRLEQSVQVAQTDLMTAAQHHPIHGAMKALSQIYRAGIDTTKDITVWTDISQRILKLVAAVTEVVVTALANPAPEGYVLPLEELEDAEPALSNVTSESDSAGVLRSQQHHYLLTYCWRSVKEVAALLEDVVTGSVQALQRTAETPLLSVEQLEACGRQLLDLLLELRHRGAFSHVYPHFETVCRVLLQSDHPQLTLLPQQWLQRLMEEMQSASISMTRRSGGIPYGVLALVSTDRTGDFLDHAMQALLALANEQPEASTYTHSNEEAEAEAAVPVDHGAETPCVHAMNTIRILLTDARLGKYITKYVEQCFILAINGMSSCSWPIRNCAVMMLSALVTRTFGVKSSVDERDALNSLSGREFFKKFPRLQPFLLAQLQPDAAQASLYPVLVILARLRPSLADNSQTDTGLQAFMDAVQQCGHSHIYKIREMAAHALVSLVSTVDMIALCDRLSLSLTALTGRTNALHGCLCQLGGLLRRYYRQCSDKETAMQQTARLEAIQLRLVAVLADHGCDMIHREVLCILRDTLGQHPALAATSAVWHRVVARAWQRLQVSPTPDAQQLDGVGSKMCRQLYAEIASLATLTVPASSEASSLLPDFTPDAVLHCLLRDCQKDPEVSEAGIRCFVQASASIPLAPTTVSTVLQCIVDSQAMHPGCLLQLSELLLLHPLASVERTHLATAVWPSLAMRAAHDSRLTCRTYLLPLLGMLLAQIPDTEDSTGCNQQWLQLLEQASLDEAAIELRRAAVQSVRVYLQTDPRVPSNLQAPLRLILANMMQDDDDEIRDDATLIAAQYLRPEPVSSLTALYLDMIHTCGPSNPTINEALMDILLPDQDDTQQASPTAEQRLFEREPLNSYRESLSDVQRACHALQQRGSHLLDNDAAVQTAILIKRMQSILHTLKAQQIGNWPLVQHPLHVLYAPSTFLTLYRLMAACTLLPDSQRQSILQAIQAVIPLSLDEDGPPALSGALASLLRVDSSTMDNNDALTFTIV